MNDKELDNYMKTVNPNFNSHFEKSTIEMNNEYYNLLEEKMARLINQNQELKKKYENAVADYETTMFEKEQLNSLVNSCQEEIRELKKQVEEKENIACNWKDSCLENAGKIEILETQQKEFIKYLEDGIDICDGFLDTVKSDLQEIPYGAIAVNKTYITTQIKENEIAHKVYEEILQKYEEIIGDDK